MMISQLAQQIVPPINPSSLPGSRDFGTWQEVIQFAINNFILPILAGLAVLYVVWAGYQFLTSAGNPEAAQKARQNLTYAIIGVILIVLSYALVRGTALLIEQSAGRLP